MCSEKSRTIILYEIPGKIDFDGVDHNSDEPSLDNLSTTDKTHLTVKEKVFKQLKGSGIVCQLLKKAWQKMKGSDVPEDDEEGHDFYEYSELEELEQLPRYRPESLSALTRTTRFTEAEIKRIYRGFKAECPTGVVKEDTFKVIYSQFFPQGANTGPYAHYIFNSLDQSRSGLVSFEDFVQGLSILSRGTLDEKLLWTFSLYDINGDGHITREEMTEIVTAIYELVGRLPDTHVDEEIVREKVEKLFEKMDTNQDGVVTLDEFLYCCRNDDTISSSMTVFDTSI